MSVFMATIKTTYATPITPNLINVMFGCCPIQFGFECFTTYLFEFAVNFNMTSFV